MKKKERNNEVLKHDIQFLSILVLTFHGSIAALKSLGVIGLELRSSS